MTNKNSTVGIKNLKNQFIYILKKTEKVLSPTSATLSPKETSFAYKRKLSACN
jgi:hypothetical protein